MVGGGPNVVDHGHALELDIVMSCEVHQCTQTLAPERCLTVVVEDGAVEGGQRVFQSFFARGQLVAPISLCIRARAALRDCEACSARPSLRRQHRAQERLRFLSVQLQPRIQGSTMLYSKTLTAL